jgi:hypothetical protein
MISGIEITASFTTKPTPTKKTGRQERVMRQMISGLIAAAAVMTAGAAPAMACGGLFGGCSPCGQAYVSPCAQSYAQTYAPAFNYTGGYAGGCGGGCGGGVAYERLPELSPQYYHVNQGPAYSGPGNFAPLPTYQESAVSGWGAYRNTSTYYGYDGGRYANATNHYYDGANVQGPAVYSYGPRYNRPWVRPGFGVGVRTGVRYGVGRGYGVGRHGLGYGAHRYGVARGYGHPGVRGYGHAGVRRY